MGGKQKKGGRGKGSGRESLGGEEGGEAGKPSVRRPGWASQSEARSGAAAAPPRSQARRSAEPARGSPGPARRARAPQSPLYGARQLSSFPPLRAKPAKVRLPWMALYHAVTLRSGGSGAVSKQYLVKSSSPGCFHRICREWESWRRCFLSLIASIHLKKNKTKKNSFPPLTRSVAIKPMGCECDNPAGSVFMFFCGWCAVICLAPEEVGRILLRAHLNRDDPRISCRLCLSVKVRTLSAKALSEQKQGRWNWNFHSAS